MSDQFKQDDIDDFFHESLHDRERTPPVPVWQKIEAGLDREKRRRLLVWWSSGIAGIIIGLSLMGLGVWAPKQHRPERNRPEVAGRAPVPGATHYRIPPASSLATGKRLEERAGGNLSLTPSPTSLRPRDNIATKISPISEPKAGFRRLPRAAFPFSRQKSPFAPQHIGDNLPGPAMRLVMRPVMQPGMRAVMRAVMQPGMRPVMQPVIPRKLRPKLTISAYLSQELAGYSLADHDSTGPHGKEIEKRENSSFSTSVGLLASYPISGRWVIESGLSLSRSVSVGSPAKAAAVKDMNGNVSYQVYTVTGYGYLASPGTTNIGDSAMTGKITGRLDYISVPLDVSRTWTTKRFSFLAGAGFSTNFLTRATVQASLSGPAGVDQAGEVAQYGLRKINFGVLIKGECRYQFANSYGITVMTTFKSSVGPVNTHTAYSTYPYNLGIGLGITRLF